MSRKSLPDLTFFSTTTMGTRGQVVIPVRIRKKLGIKAGGKFMVFLAPPRAVIFIPSNQFERMVSEFDKRLIKLRRLAK